MEGREERRGGGQERNSMSRRHQSVFDEIKESDRSSRYTTRRTVFRGPKDSFSRAFPF